MHFGGDPMAALDRLIDATERGDIDRICEQRGVDLLGVFGSAVRHRRDTGTPAPRDLDVAVQFTDQQPLLELIGDLTDLTNYDGLDVAVLNGGTPELRAAGLTGIGLFERTPGAWATAQMAALAEYHDTRHLRLLDLEALAG
jgi:predicted nucleotidyltransferase